MAQHVTLLSLSGAEHQSVCLRNQQWALLDTKDVMDIKSTPCKAADKINM